MRLNRFFFPYNFSAPFITIRDKKFIHQLRNVLRIKEGQEILLFNNKEEALAIVRTLRRGFIELEIKERRKNLVEPQKYVILYCALLKKGNFELVVQKTTEIGVKEIVPLLTKRTIKQALKRERLERIIKEAAEQSGRGTVPLLDNPLSFSEALRYAAANEANYFFDREGELFSSSLVKGKKKIGVFIGPEGGWSAEEKELARKNKFIICSLGKLTFRAETAAIISSYLAIYN